MPFNAFNKFGIPALRIRHSGVRHSCPTFSIPVFGIPACSQWNSLPNWVVTANNTKIFKKRIDHYRQHRDIIFDFRAQIEGTGSHSEVLRVNIVQFIMYFCITYPRSWQKHIACASTSSTSTCGQAC